MCSWTNLLSLVVLACCCLDMAAGASMGLFFSAGVVQQVTTPLTATVMARVDATHPPQHGSSSGGATVTFSNFNFDLVLQTFRFVAPDAAGWMYFAESVSFDYHIAQNSFPWVSESGTIYIFTTNQNQKTLTVAGSVNFAGVTPALDATSAAVGVEQYDLYIVGQCSDTVCLIPVRLADVWSTTAFHLTFVFAYSLFTFFPLQRRYRPDCSERHS